MNRALRNQRILQRLSLTLLLASVTLLGSACLGGGSGEENNENNNTPDMVDDTMESDMGAPDTGDPDTGDSDMAQPDAEDPDMIEPDMVEPDMVEPDMVEPDMVEPDMVEPDMDDPDMVEPDMVEPDMDDPDMDDPDMPPCEDADEDGVCDADDICAQGDDSADADSDGVPDACDVCAEGDDNADADADGVADACDVCAEGDDNADADSDGVPDACDVCAEGDDSADADADGVADACDVCAEGDDIADADSDGVPDACDVCAQGDDNVDGDADGVADACDICLQGPNDADADSDGVPDACDACAQGDDAADADADGVADACDVCAQGDDGADADSDGVPDACDVCAEGDDNADADADGVADACDVCPAGDDNADADGDGVADACDVCPAGDDNADADGDGVPNACDACPGGDDNADADGDGVADACDACPAGDDNADADSDGVADACDVCPAGDDDVDTDGDGVPNACDVCPQADDNADGDGDTVICALDCDDNNAARYPGNAEICDSLDNDCNGAADDGIVCTPPGVQDGSFGEGGVVTVEREGARVDLRALQVSSTGDIVVAGSIRPEGGRDDVLVMRYLEDGVLDSMFGTTGQVLWDGNGDTDRAYGLWLGQDEIFVAGHTDMGAGPLAVVLHYTHTGAVHPTWDSFLANSPNNSTWYELLPNNGGVFMVGDGRPGATRVGMVGGVNAQGEAQPEALSTRSGVTDLTFQGAALRADGSFVVGGRFEAGYDDDLYLACYQANLTPCTDWGTNGAVPLDLSNDNRESAEGVADMLIDDMGRLWVVGQFDHREGNSDFLVMRFLPDGTLDNSFNGQGWIAVDFGEDYDEAFAAALTPQGQLVVVGSVFVASSDSDAAAAIRINADGTVDTGFGTNGFFVYDVNELDDAAVDVAVQGDQVILLINYETMDGLRASSLIRLSL